METQIFGGKPFQQLSETLWAMHDGHMPRFARGDMVETLAVVNGEVTPDVPGAGVIVSGKWDAMFEAYRYRVRWPDEADTPKYLLDEYYEDELVLVQKGALHVE